MFQVIALSPEPFDRLFDLSDEALAARGARRLVAEENWPCRISLDEAVPGEPILLVNHEHQPADTPYRSRHAIFVTRRERAAGPEAGGSPQDGVCSDHADVLRFLTLAAGADVELDGLALVEGLVARGLDVGEVDEHVVAVFTGDEAVALLSVEELDGTDCHGASAYLCQSVDRSSATTVRKEATPSPPERVLSPHRRGAKFLVGRRVR
jgi:hypothetical protein